MSEVASDRGVAVEAGADAGGGVGVGIVGCGYVFDHYLATWGRHPELRLVGVTDIDRARVDAVTDAYDLHGYADLDVMLADPAVDIVVNLTGIASHAEVTRAAILAGKHVFTEKPVAEGLEQARALFDLAEQHGVMLGAAPSNALSPSIQTLWKALRDGAVGTPRVVYAEFDDNPIYLMHPERWRSRTGAPWPYVHEYEHGCTIEHAGYHLVWLCALFGPVTSVTAFAKQVIPDKTNVPLDPPDTPDLSVACLDFASGVVARVTFSIAAPLDHSLQIFGDEGMLSVETYRHYECPVLLERFTDVTLNARKARSVRTNGLLRWLLGVGGRRLPLVPAPFGRAPASAGPEASRSVTSLLERLKRRETGVQDKTIGIAELAAAVRAGRPPFPAPDLSIHVTELTYAIQEAGTQGGPHRLRTTFEPPSPAPSTLQAPGDYRPPLRTRLLDALLRRRLDRMHQH